MSAAVILLVEDNVMDIELTLDAFAQVGLKNTINVARTGEEALNYIYGKGKFADRKSFPTPDLVLLDLKLPGISGHEVLSELKNDERTRRIPVIVLTSSHEEGDRAVCYNNGVNSYLVKPIDFGEFVKVVRAIGDYWLTLNVGPPKLIR
ncbi:MAG TPA: response regulator [Mesotoga infera]|uniref:Response regulator receiver protein n=1 Tax=Mesotoga infera TaxID=1236046 RepID=A0A7Z7PPV7_9BACT|nr:response regulator [Mesotoga infera]SSC13824.1 Response regulator receiver protein [Mesotoga infera]HPD38648.1 response regulator [Mesotoga infera]HRR45057.1 response regulator [Mesotoga sp.]HRV01567.1 response regulator [Mesotoga sp.]